MRQLAVLGASPKREKREYLKPAHQLSARAGCLFLFFLFFSTEKKGAKNWPHKTGEAKDAEKTQRTTDTFGPYARICEHVLGYPVAGVMQRGPGGKRAQANARIGSLALAASLRRKTLAKKKEE